MTVMFLIVKINKVVGAEKWFIVPPKVSCGVQKCAKLFSAGALPRTPLGDLTTLPQIP